MPPKRSIVHQFFKTHSAGKVVCLICEDTENKDKPLSVLGGNSNLKRHLETHHLLELHAAQDDARTESVQSQANISLHSFTFKYFEDVGKNSVRCLLCHHDDKESLLNKSGGTANYARHMQLHHPKEFQLETDNALLRKKRKRQSHNANHSYSLKRDLLLLDGGDISVVDGEETVEGEVNEDVMGEGVEEEMMYHSDEILEDDEGGMVGRLTVQKMKLEVYKLKLEALKLERELQLPLSDYTRDIVR